HVQQKEGNSVRPSTRPRFIFQQQLRPNKSSPARESHVQRMKECSCHVQRLHASNTFVQQAVQRPQPVQQPPSVQHVDQPSRSKQQAQQFGDAVT
ncbi:hypothetical protein VIGAN_09122200, partial [Vigna angularis var. angularis]